MLRVGPLVLVLLSTLAGKVGAALTRCDSTYCASECSNQVILPNGEMYRKTTTSIGACSCSGKSFPVYQEYTTTGQTYNNFMYYDCATETWGTGVIRYSNGSPNQDPTLFPGRYQYGLSTWSTLGSNTQCPISGSASCASSPPPSPPPLRSPPPWTSYTTGSTTGGSTNTPSFNTPSIGSSNIGTGGLDCGGGEKKKSDPAAITYVLYGISGLMAVLAIAMAGLLLVSCKEGKESDPKLTGTLSKEEILKQAGWGPYGFLFPQVWIKVWFGYFAMLLVVTVVIPSITPSGPDTCDIPGASSSVTPSVGPWLEALVAIGPFVQLLLMPVLWKHKHQQVKAKIMGEAPPEEENNPLDPEAMTTIFGMKLPCKAVVLGLLIGSVDFILRMVKRFSFGTINLQAFFFPAPFYNFYSAKLLIKELQVDGRRIAITATQADSYMKFCTEQMINFWTLGFYGLCCKGRTCYNRWLDRHLVWQGGTPKGYNEQFRVFDDKLTCVQKLKMFGLNLAGGCLSIFPIVGALWPVAQIAQWYRYKLDLLNMKFGGAQPYFVEEFTACNYTMKYYTIGVCGLCSMPVKKYVDTCIKMGEPTFDKDMAAEDKVADAGSPDDAPPGGVEMQPVAVPEKV